MSRQNNYIEDIAITKNEIKDSEKYFIDGEFDDESISFIEYLGTCDLLAVPGSGKTTSLLAKLYCLSKKLPFKDGSGILILAHTNSAIDEIKRKLGSHCSTLFEYPNFIGTIQSFINQYLAIPFYTNSYNYRPYKIDDKIYNNEVTKMLEAEWGTEIVYLKGQKSPIFLNARYSLDEHGEPYLTNGLSEEILKFNPPEKWIKEETVDEKNKIVFRFIRKLKKTLFEKGILHFDDCYFLAETYIFKYPQIKQHLQSRFKYVFIDEMQDLHKYQIDIIDKIFFSKTSGSIIQRIGDKNQAIYNSGKAVKVECEWRTREEVSPAEFKDKYLQGSYRLTKEVASLVNYFTIEKSEKFILHGKRVLENGIIIKPHLIVFNIGDKAKLKAKFIELIKNYDLKSNNKFKIIGWNSEWNNEEDSKDKLRLKDIFPEYSKEKSQKRDEFNNLSDYLQLYNSEVETLKAIRNSILNALIYVLRLEEKKHTIKIRGNEIQIFYSKSRLIDDLRSQKAIIDYEKFKELLLEWCMDIIKGKVEAVFENIKTFILNDFKDWFELKINTNTKSFISEFHKIDTEEISEDIFEPNIEICTIHAAKGQTHCATLYVETAYKLPVYESLKLNTEKTKKGEYVKGNVLFKEEHNYKKVGQKEALKMMYVGFSRPTHLLCFAALEQNVKDNIEKFENSGWEIINL